MEICSTIRYRVTIIIYNVHYNGCKYLMKLIRYQLKLIRYHVNLIKYHIKLMRCHIM